MDDLPENQLKTTLNNLKTEFTTIKNKQIVGTESVRPNRYFTPYLYDARVVSATYNTQAFRVSFTPDNAVQFQGLVYRMMYTVTPSSGFFWESSFVRERPVGSVQYWLFTVLSDIGTLDFKFYLAGASSGTIGITSV